MYDGAVWFKMENVQQMHNELARAGMMGRDKMANISQMTLSDAFSLMKIYEFHLIFHWSLFLRVQLTISLHWFR